MICGKADNQQHYNLIVLIFASHDTTTIRPFHWLEMMLIKIELQSTETECIKLALQTICMHTLDTFSEFARQETQAN